MAAKTLSSEELMRYQRHLSLPQIGEIGQTKLNNAKILCVGVGGLGCASMTYLAAAGVGTIGIIDHDDVAISNLQRQILFTEADVGRAKVAVAKQKLQQLNPFVQINSYYEQLTDKNVFDVINDYDIVIDGSDNYQTSYLINDACFYAEKPAVLASIFQFQGQCSIFQPGNGPCYRCLFPDPPTAELMPNCAEAGVLGVLPAVIGSIQATETIKLLCDIGDSLVGRLLGYDALTMSFSEFVIQFDPACVLCVENKPFDKLPRIAENCEMTDKVPTVSVAEYKQMLADNKDVLLLDVRELHEYQFSNMQGKHVPLNDLPEKLAQLPRDKSIIVHCRSGGRSAKAVEFLLANGFNSVFNLEGGILAWEAEKGA